MIAIYRCLAYTVVVAAVSHGLGVKSKSIVLWFLINLQTNYRTQC